MQNRSKWGTYKRRRDTTYGRPQTHTLTNPDIIKILKTRTYIDPMSDCWIWEGAKNKKGYGHTRLDFKTVNLSRIAGVLFLGLKLEDMDTHVLHKCPNKACWNPEHLYLGDNFNNWKDRKEGSEVTNLSRPTNKDDE